MSYPPSDPIANSPAPTESEIWDWEKQEHGKRCELCNHRYIYHPSEVKRHVQSGNYVCAKHMPEYIANEREYGEEPTFEDVTF